MASMPGRGGALAPRRPHSRQTLQLLPWTPSVTLNRTAAALLLFALTRAAPLVYKTCPKSIPGPTRTRTRGHPPEGRSTAPPWVAPSVWLLWSAGCWPTDSWRQAGPEAVPGRNGTLTLVPAAWEGFRWMTAAPPVDQSPVSPKQSVTGAAARRRQGIQWKAALPPPSPGASFPLAASSWTKRQMRKDAMCSVMRMGARFSTVSWLKDEDCQRTAPSFSNSIPSAESTSFDPMKKEPVQGFSRVLSRCFRGSLQKWSRLSAMWGFRTVSNVNWRVGGCVCASFELETDVWRTCW